MNIYEKIIKNIMREKSQKYAMPVLRDTAFTDNVTEISGTATCICAALKFFLI